MSEDRRTKSQILAELAKAQETIVNLESRIPGAPTPVPVATALQGAIRALDPIAKQERSSLYSDRTIGASQELIGVMKHLLHRYGVDLTERTVEPCDRRHLDDASETELISRLRGWVGP